MIDLTGWKDDGGMLLWKKNGLFAYYLIHGNVHCPLCANDKQD